MSSANDQTRKFKILDITCRLNFFLLSHFKVRVVGNPGLIQQSCWSCTKRPWATASSNYLMQQSSSMPIYTKNSTLQNVPTNCMSCKQNTQTCSLIGLACRLKLKALHRFTSTATAVEDITALQNGKLGKGLKKFLTDEVLGKGKGKDQQKLLVVDSHLGAHAFLYAMKVLI